MSYGATLLAIALLSLLAPLLSWRALSRAARWGFWKTVHALDRRRRTR